MDRLKNPGSSNIQNNSDLQNNITNYLIEHPDFIAVSLSSLYKAASIIHKSIQNNEKVYIHCKAGRGRSAGSIAQ